ncbi:hypothetical protein NXV44_16880 [Bacteroides thetaiotaomicron]|nr:hypothetical protein [Bacteroides thetaiotaomicron]
MGCVGMCLNDFCRLTPSEFTAVFEAWQQQETYAERRGVGTGTLPCMQHTEALQ